MNKYIFWWDSPCKGMVGVFQYFCENLSQDSLAITGNLGNFRESMGWTDGGRYFENHIVVLKDDDWILNTTNYLNKYKYDYIHIFGGATRGKFAHLVKKASKENLRFCIMTEAPFNNKFGFSKLIKDVYINKYLPLKTRLFAKKTLLVFCLSGKKKKDLKMLEYLGYDSGKIVPFGYYTVDHDNYEIAIKTKSENSLMSIICPGVLEAYKGVDVLINALNILVSKGYANFRCHITGLGEQYNRLVTLMKKYNLEKHICFEGILDERKFSDLSSKIDILVAPGYSEPWGIRINEAIQRGQVVICSDGLGASDLILDSGGGVVFPSGNIKELANSIQYYLDNPIEISDGKKANLLYKETISCKNKANELLNHLNNL